MSYNLCMEITYSGICGAVIIGLTVFVRFLYLATVNKKRFPDVLFKGKNLIFFIISLVMALSGLVVCLLLTKTIENLGLFIVWAFLSGASGLLELSIWVLFWLHGYEVRYQFEKIIAFCPFVILETIILLSTALCSLNIPLICIGVVYFIFSFIWHLKGWSLTKPDETIHREGEDD